MFHFYRSIIIGLAVSGFTIAHAETDCNQVTQIPVSECQELLALYNSTSFDTPDWKTNWSIEYRWNQTNTPCSWYGITCANGHVIKLNGFSDAGLRVEIPDLNLPELQELSIGSGRLYGNIPDFSYLPKLQSLSISYNFEFGGNIPNFTNLPNLQSLYVWNNDKNGNGNIPDFSNLPNLKVLGLYLGKINNIPNFSKLPNLEKLSLGSYSAVLTKSTPNYVQPSTLILPDFNFPKLTSLEVFWLDLTGTSVPNFSNLPNLAVLNLDGSNLTGSIPNFSNLPNLVVLKLNGNNLTGSIPNFSNLPNLVTLELAYNYLTGNIPNFSNIPNLGGLNLAGNYLTGSFPNFSNLPHLLGINFVDNFLNGVIPNFTSFNLSKINPTYSKLGGNCGLTSYDKIQEALLNHVLPDWANLKKQYSIADVSCSALTTCPIPIINPTTFGLSIPNLSYNNSNMSTNLRFVQRDGKVFFELIDYKVNSALFESIDCIDDPTVTCKKPKPSCSSANLTPDFKLHIPMATFGDMKLWADLQLHSVENNKIVFELVNYGNT
jgi:Leucine-rich repeat (LRR) protein